MTLRSDGILTWSPRVLGILASAFLGMFALDAFGPGKPVVQAVGDFLIHVAPAVALLLVVVLSWRWEWVGGGVFSAGALLYAYAARSHPTWILVISGPLLLVGVLFLLSWRRHRRMRPAR